MTEPSPTGLDLVHEHGRSLRISFAGRPLLRYVYQPWEAQPESPRPYFHPLHTLGGHLVSLYRPHDHVWHKGIAWSLPDVGSANFAGGITYRRGRGRRQLPSNGTIRHRRFDLLDVTAQEVRVAHRLAWMTGQDETWFTELRSFAVAADPTGGAWTLAFATEFTNVSGREIAIGGSAAEGRDTAGYGGLFWRGPREFTGGTVYVPGGSGGNELMGVRARWMGFSGRHDEHGGASTLVFVDGPGNGTEPTRWFVRSSPFACLCPSPFLGTEVRLTAGGTTALRYAVTIADGDAGDRGCTTLAKTGLAALARFDEAGEEL